MPKYLTDRKARAARKARKNRNQVVAVELDPGHANQNEAGPFGLNINRGSSDESDDIPLDQLLAHRRVQSNADKPIIEPLDISVAGPSGSCINVESSSDDDVPLQQRLLRMGVRSNITDAVTEGIDGNVAGPSGLNLNTSRLRVVGNESSASSDDDVPLDQLLLKRRINTAANLESAKRNSSGKGLNYDKKRKYMKTYNQNTKNKNVDRTLQPGVSGVGAPPAQDPTIDATNLIETSDQRQSPDLNEPGPSGLQRPIEVDISESVDMPGPSGIQQPIEQALIELNTEQVEDPVDVNVSVEIAQVEHPIDGNEAIVEEIPDPFNFIPFDLLLDEMDRFDRAIEADPPVLAEIYEDVVDPLRPDLRRVIPLARRPVVENDVVEHSCGLLEWRCLNCDALYFKDEIPRQNRHSLNRTADGVMQCCAKGRFNLPQLGDRPEALMDLITGLDAQSGNFMNAIREYNSSLAFVSSAGDTEMIGVEPYGRVFRVHGQIHHRLSVLQPAQHVRPSFGQLYIVDSDLACDYRLQRHSTLNNNILRHLDRLLREVNPFCEAYRMLHEVESAELAAAAAEGRIPSEVYMLLIQDQELDPRRYNRPTASNEVAAVYVSRDGMPPADRHLAVYPRQYDFLRNPLKTIDYRNRNIDPMTYPLLFPRGEPGWEPQMMYDVIRGTRGHISTLQFYGYRLAIRPGFNHLLSCGKLTQQYIVDAFIKTEGLRLVYHRENQDRLRSELYTGLMDHIHNLGNREAADIGRITILPSSFTGSIRSMQQLYQDAMAIVRKHGRPDLFITFTANPSWPEVQGLLNGARPADRPDVIARVFNVKFTEFLNDMIKKKIMGQVKAYVYTIEFQKRGLPHAHCLFILNEADKPTTTEAIDEIVSAEIPDPVTNPRLRAVVKSMMHNYCEDPTLRTPCRENGLCSKKFPKPFSEETIIVNGYPVYRRRQRHTILRNNRELTNQYVVPYNPYLLLKYNTHINVEVCVGLSGVKYLFKYIFKGHDAARIIVVERERDANNNDNDERQRMHWDEVRSFLDARYVSAVEAVWRLRAFDLQGRSHPVIRLPVHLPFQQNVVFVNGQEREAADRNVTTMLTAWFELNERDVRANQYLYPDIPDHYTYEKRTKRWNPRQRGEVVSRMYHVKPSDTERFHLRLLLLHVRGAISFEDLRTVDGVVHQTYSDAARALHLTEDDQEWTRCLQEAATHQMPKQLRQMFAVMLIYCQISNPNELWEMFRDQMSEDFVRRRIPVDHSYQRALRDIQYTLNANGKSLADFNLPELVDIPEHVMNLGLDENVHNEIDERNEAARNRDLFNDEQRHFFNAIVAAVYGEVADNRRCFLLEGAAGTGKTFVYNTLLSYIRGRGDRAIACAYTGIAATLLKGGVTINSCFKLPLRCHETSSSCVNLNSPHADTLRNAKLIIMDEVTMMNKFHLNMIDHLLKILMGRRDIPFGGKPVLLGGDFRQTMPIIPRATRAEITLSTIKSSFVFRLLQTFSLTQNMRLAPEENEYSTLLLNVGNGTVRDLVRGNDKFLKVQANLLCESVVDEIFGPIITAEDAEEYVQSAILSPKNVDTTEMNNVILERLQGRPVEYASFDSMREVDEDGIDQLNVDIEFLNNLNPSGFPPHILKLKTGCIVMLLRNINVSRGLVNGTRMKIVQLRRDVIQAQVLTGTSTGEMVFLTRIDMTDENSPFPFSLKRRQFPLKLSYCMTINKAQGQTLTKVGLYLPSPVFSHGQLYVAMSRVRTAANIKFQVETTAQQGQIIENSNDVYTPNVVWPEVL